MHITRLVAAGLNSSPPSAAYMHQWIESVLAQIMSWGTNLNQSWVIINWILGNKLQWNFNQNTKLFIDKSASENIVCKMASTLSRPQCVNSLQSTLPVRPQGSVCHGSSMTNSLRVEIAFGRVELRMQCIECAHSRPACWWPLSMCCGVTGVREKLSERLGSRLDQNTWTIGHRSTIQG